MVNSAGQPAGYLVLGGAFFFAVRTSDRSTAAKKDLSPSTSSWQGVRAAISFTAQKKTFNRHDDSSVHPGIIQALGKPFHKELLPEGTAGPNPGFVPKRFVELY
jgi:hypothetical protein